MLGLGLLAASWMKQVRANILKHTTPLEVRQAEAGNQQFAQGAVHKLPVSGLLGHLLEEMTRDNPANPNTQVARAIQKAGHPRFSTNVCICASLSSFWLTFVQEENCSVFLRKLNGRSGGTSISSWSPLENGEWRGLPTWRGMGWMSPAGRSE